MSIRKWGQPRIPSRLLLNLCVGRKVRFKGGQLLKILVDFLVDEDIAIGVGHCELSAIMVVLKIGLLRERGTMEADVYTWILRGRLCLDYDLPRIVQL